MAEIGDKFEEQENKEADKKIKKVDNVVSVVAAVLATAVAVGLLISTFTLYAKYEEQEKKNDELTTKICLQEEQLSNQNNQIAEQAEEIQAMKDAMALLTKEVGNLPGGDMQGSVAVERGDNDLFGHASELDEKNGQTENGQSDAGQAEGADEGRVYLKSYVVQKGDTLPSICEKEGIDYDANYRIIMAMNGISDDVSDMVGQKILLPTNK